MIKRLQQAYTVKALAMMLLLPVGLWQTPTAIADQSSDDPLSVFEANMNNALPDSTYVALSENQLKDIRGEGVDAVIPQAPMELGVILWDEGDTKKGGHNGQGYGNSVVTVKVHWEVR
ncbi:hypothetical protein EH243_14620 [Amphritea opalescens]|uniref:Uncharacterized protein n=1 Tax=Amphritea opalescens TaxID=2490544 RepID=A0A430KN39_9GAMM|nr:hypothetical protein [Amphritea opalescens]RTE64911.1 hypothetical protein EH243_14620 [Amphritea opalescens]